MNIESMTMQEVEARLAEISTEMTADGADLDALDKEVDQLFERRAAITAAAAKERELRAKVAQGVGTVIASTNMTAPEERKQEETKMEFRNTPEYINAYAEAIKTGDWTECRSLLTENVQDGTVQVPDIVADRIETAWENDEIMRRINRVFVKGNYTIGFEISGTDAVIHVEGTAAPAEEQLVLGKVTLIPQSLKKWISTSTEVMSLKGQAFLNYLYDEIAYRIVRKAAELVITAIITNANDTTGTVPAVAKMEEDLTVATIVKAEAYLADGAADVVAIMNRQTYAAIRTLKVTNGENVSDPLDGLDVVFSSALAASTNTDGNPYMIVGDLGGVTGNFPDGDEVKFIFDELTLAPEDMVRIIGKLMAAFAVTKPGHFTVVYRAA